jgi:urea transport system permease protein
MGKWSSFPRCALLALPCWCRCEPGCAGRHPLHLCRPHRRADRQVPDLCLLALAVDLVWGYCGILSLGHGAFFALGGYAMGMYLMRQIGTRGVYGDPVLPDFMVFLNWKELPWYWYGFDNSGSPC